MKIEYNVIDLFCGCGGFSKGFEDAGFNVVLGVDINVDALNSFSNNHSNSSTFNGDLSVEETFTQFGNVIKSTNIDVIVGGPPCQGFSLTGSRNIDDPRNKLYLAMIKTVEIYKPKAFVIENVAGMATLYKGKAKEEIVRRFEELGYNVSYQIMNSADYGIPQVRKRLIFVGVKQKFGYYKFPNKTHNESNYESVSSAISDLPTRENKIGLETDDYIVNAKTKYQKYIRDGMSKLYNHVGTKHSKIVVETIMQVPEGGNHKDLPEGVGTSRKFNEAWTRYHGNKPSKTIDTGHRNHFHYKYNRVPTVRENARLQSFKDSFVFSGSKTSQYRQVGNAVPPLLGYYISKSLIETLKGKIINE